jgi:hypothetical protein
VSSLWYPVGPKPASVYWRRRLLVAVVIVGIPLFALVAVNAVRQPGRPAGGDVAASAVASAGVPASTNPSPTGEPMGCADDAISVTAQTDAATYRVGEGAVLTLGITNTSGAACLRDIGPKANELIITSGGYHVWSSDDCRAGNKSKVATLQPGERFVSTISWDGLMSRKGCPDISKKAKAGSYELVGRNGNVMSDPTRFSLRRKTG